MEEEDDINIGTNFKFHRYGVKSLHILKAKASWDIIIVCLLCIGHKCVSFVIALMCKYGCQMEYIFSILS